MTHPLITKPACKKFSGFESLTLSLSLLMHVLRNIYCIVLYPIITFVLNQTCHLVSSDTLRITYEPKVYKTGDYAAKRSKTVEAFSIIFFKLMSNQSGY